MQSDGRMRLLNASPKLVTETFLLLPANCAGDYTAWCMPPRRPNFRAGTRLCGRPCARRW